MRGTSRVLETDVDLDQLADPIRIWIELARAGQRSRRRRAVAKMRALNLGRPRPQLGGGRGLTTTSQRGGLVLQHARKLGEVALQREDRRDLSQRSSISCPLLQVAAQQVQHAAVDHRPQGQFHHGQAGTQQLFFV
ncbi:MAG: hypothetical protein B7733_12675 [Myxococcales bacterium FL481]|nr:MAG: hypothetical protein B7733_12675 [Myxococcales bacterium FL481]